MFTGIIEDQGIVKTFKKLKDYQLIVSSKNKFKGIKKGSSICCDGVCLTVLTQLKGLIIKQNYHLMYLKKQLIAVILET